MFLIRLHLFVCVNLFLYAKCSIPVEKLCVNPTCKEPISKAQGSVRYNPNTEDVLGFQRGQEITITSKSRNANDYWGAVINGKSGYVPSNLIKEVKVFHKIDDLIPVSVEMPQQSNSKENGNPLKNSTLDKTPVNKDEVEKSSSPQLIESVVDIANNLENLNTMEKPINPSETFKIIEGTTIYSDETDEIIPSATISVKSSPHTIDNKLSGGSSQGEITISSETVSLNNASEGQNLESQNNFTVENIKENDKNKNTESKDVYAEEDGGDDEDDDGDDDDDDDDDDEEEEEEEERDETENDKNYNSVIKSHLDKEKESSIATLEKTSKITKSQLEKEESSATSSKEASRSSTYQETEQISSSSPESNSVGSKENLLRTSVYVLENSVTRKVSTNAGNDRIEAPSEQQLTAMLSSQNLDVNKVEMPTQEASNSWSILSGFKEEFSHKAGVKIQSQPPAGSFDVKYTDSQDVVANSRSKTHIVSERHLLSEMKFEVSAESLDGTDIETPDGSTPQLIQQNTAEASTATSQVPLATDSHIYDAVTSGVLEELSTEAFASSPHSNVQENSKLLSQFSVSADTLIKNTKNIGGPAITPEIIQEKMKETTEAFAASSESFATETAQASLASSQVASVPVADDTTPEIMQEKVELTTKATIMHSVLPEIITKESLPKEISKNSEDTKITEDLSAFSENELKDTTSSNIMSQIAVMILSWFSSASKEELPGEKENNYKKTFHDILSSQKEETKSSGISSEAPSGTCQNPKLGFDCKDFSSTEEPLSSWSVWIPTGIGFDSILMHSNTFLYLVVTAITVLLFTLGHNLIEKRGKTGPLIGKINKLEHELLVTSKECFLFKDEAQSLREKITLYENSANDELVVSLQAELEESKKVRSELESSIEVLQQELDAATEAGLDLNKMLSEVLTQKGGSESLLKSVENLQAQLDSQQKVIDEMTKKLGVKNQENEALQVTLEAANEKSERLEEQLIDIKHNLNLHLKEKEDLSQDLNSQISLLKTRINQLEDGKKKEISKLKKELEELQKKLSETSNALIVKEEEVKTLKESMKLLKTKGDIKLETVFDVSRVKAELAKEVKENQTLLEKLQEEENNKKVLGGQVKALNDEMQELRRGLEEAEQKKDEAEKKLDVLSTYFKEKETQLQKELGLQEALWAQKKGDEKAVYNMMKSLQEEVESYKSQNETLKKEILDQERGLKNQIASLEQKAYENWVAARQAERKLEESKQEMAQLRNRLTLIEKNSNNVEGKGNPLSSEELNGVEAVSPVLHDTSSPLLFPPLPIDPNNSNLLPPGFMPPPMFLPPPMGGFIPPPPFLPGDRRPPPLGRMSSPPLNNRFSPSSPADYPFERMSSPPLCLPGSNYRSPNDERELYRHTTPPYPLPLHPRNWDNSNELPGFIPISSHRDSRRDHKGSNVSSEHSSSESLDKSSRHSGRV